MSVPLPPVMRLWSLLRISVNLWGSPAPIGPFISMTGSRRLIQLSHKPNFEDLIFIKELIESGKVVTVIDRQYPLSNVSEAVRYFSDGNPAGKIVIKIDSKNNNKI